MTDTLASIFMTAAMSKSPQSVRMTTGKQNCAIADSGQYGLNQ
jgi:hypothetical protein